MQEIIELIEGSALSDYHSTANTVFRKLKYEDSSSELFGSLLNRFLQSKTQAKGIYFYILEHLVLHNSDNLRQNKLSSLLNLALAVSLDLDAADAESVKLGLLIIGFHLKNIVKSGLFIPQVWKFIIRVYEHLQIINVKKYIKKEWKDILSSNPSHVDLIHILIKTTSSLVQNNKLTLLSDKLKPLLQDLKTKVVNEQLLDNLISSFREPEKKLLQVEEIDSSIPFMIRELTPRILATEKTPKDELNLLKKKKAQLQKRVIGDLRSRIYDRMQEQQIKDEARVQRIKRRHKKQLFMIQKQTAEGKKLHRMKKISKTKGSKKGK